MRRTERRRIACFCDNVFEAELPSVIDLAGEPGASEDVERGGFMAVACPSCGKLLTPEYPCRFTGVPAGALGSLEVQLVPEADRVAFLRARLPYDIGAPDRVVIGVPELAEKLRIFRFGLDDRVVEILKHMLLARMPGGVGGEPSAEPVATLARLEGDQLVFEVSGVRAGEVAVARLGRTVHDKVAAELGHRLAEEPARLFCAPPYVSVRRIEEGED